jgi:hypothetical protein
MPNGILTDLLKALFQQTPCSRVALYSLSIISLIQGEGQTARQIVRAHDYWSAPGDPCVIPARHI